MLKNRVGAFMQTYENAVELIGRWFCEFFS